MFYGRAKFSSWREKLIRGEKSWKYWLILEWFFEPERKEKKKSSHYFFINLQWKFCRHETHNNFSISLSLTLFQHCFASVGERSTENCNHFYLTVEIIHSNGSEKQKDIINQVVKMQIFICFGRQKLKDYFLWDV